MFFWLWPAAPGSQNALHNMEALRLDTLAAQVVAWHNRHPLARRISAAQVHSMGYVVLPGMQAQQPGSSGAGPLSTPPSTLYAATVAAGPDDESAPGLLGTPLFDEPAARVAVPAAVPVDADANADANADADTDAAAVAAPLHVDPEPLTEAPPTLAAADAAAGAIDAPPSDAPVVLPDDTAVVATEPVSHAAADATAAAKLADDASATPSLRVRLTSRPALALPSVATVAKSMPAPPATAPAVPTAGSSPGTAAAALRLAFTERFFEHESPRRVADWALQQARVLFVRLPAGAAVRRVQRDPSLSAAAPGTDESPVDLLLRTATLEVGGRRLRLLIGPGDDPAVLGTRLWSLPRTAVACLPLVLLPLTAGAAWWLGAQSVRSTQALAAVQPAGRAASAVVAPESASAAEGAHALAADGHAVPHAGAAGHQAGAAAHQAGVAASAALGHEGAGAAPGQHPQAADAAFAAFAASAAAPTVLVTEPPVEAEPRLGRIELPPLGPLFSDPGFEPTMQRRLAARAARAAANPAAAAQPAVATATAVSASPSTASSVVPAAKSAANAALAPPPAEPAALAPLPPAVAFALTTRPLRTAAESEQVQAAMRTLLAMRVEGSARVQRVPVGDDWRVMGGPFVSRAAADKARAQLLARGVKTEVVEIPAAATVAAVVATER